MSFVSYRYYFNKLTMLQNTNPIFDETQLIKQLITSEQI